MVCGSLHTSGLAEMNYDIMPVFAEPLCITNIEEEFCKPLRKLKGMAQENTENKNFNVLDKLPKVKNKLIKVFSDYINLHILNTPEQRWQITTSWITENTNGSQMFRHNHLNSYYSSVFYFDEVAEEHPPLILENSLRSSGFWVSPKAPNIYSGDDFMAPMHKGCIIFFPSYIFHYHHPFVFNKIPRKSLACNYIPIGRYGDYDSSLDTRRIHG